MRRDMLGELVGGRYRLERELGRGGFGVVYVAVQTDLGRRVALKLLHRRHLQGVGSDRFRREATLAQYLAHPNTVRLFDFGLHDGMPFIVFELLSGESLASLLRRQGPLPPDRVIHLTVQILKSLMEAHEQGIVHRDIKPENLFVCSYAGEQDFVKVLDFGIAKSVADESASLTGTGEAVGTPSYMPPEQLSGGVLGPATDLYAVGLVMAEMLSGSRVVGGSAMEAAMRQMDPRPVAFPPSVVHSPLWPVIERATQKHASQRFVSAGFMLSALEELRVPTQPSLPPSMSRTLQAEQMATRAIGGVGAGYAQAGPPVSLASAAPTVSLMPPPAARSGCSPVLIAAVAALAVLALAGVGLASYAFLDVDSILAGRAGEQDAGVIIESVSTDASVETPDGGSSVAALPLDAGSTPTSKVASTGGVVQTVPTGSVATAPTAGSATPTGSGGASATKGGPTLGTTCTSTADCKGAFEVCAAGGTCQCDKSPYNPPRQCGSRCVANTDPNNCGACGVRCADDEVCTTNMGGSPQHPICYKCTLGAYGSVRILCGPHVCVAPNSDPRNCGGCNKKCKPGQSCENGVCK
ncbi:MAG: protein kinase [Polyangiaceae bacterium]